MKKRISLVLCMVLLICLCLFRAAAAGQDGIITVDSVDALIEAIAPGAVIQLQEGRYDLAQAVSYGGRTGNPYVRWGESWQGWQLQIHDVDGLVISGAGKGATEILAECCYANVLDIQDSTGVVLQNFTAGHLVQAEACSGGVVNLYRCEDVELKGLGLYGCGSIGVEANGTVNLRILDTEIYECSSTGIYLYNCSDVRAEDCSIHDLGMTENSPYQAFAALSVNSCTGFTAQRCAVFGNVLDTFLYCCNSSEVHFADMFISGNSVTDAMMNLVNSRPVFDGGVEFSENTFRRWYAPSWESGMVEDWAVDPEGEAVIFEDPAPLHTSSEPIEFTPVESGEQNEVRVGTVDEFLAAIAPNTRIVLTSDFYDLSTALGYGGRGTPWYYWEECFDGPGLVIVNVSNLTIVSEDGIADNHTIAAVPRYANVLTFRNCINVTVQGITAGHTEGRSTCSGGVLSFEYCADVLAENCSLFGCGILGVSSECSQSLQIANCRIYECSYGGIYCSETSGLTIGGCEFWDLGGAVFQLYGCSDVAINGQEVSGNFYGD